MPRRRIQRRLGTRTGVLRVSPRGRRSFGSSIRGRGSTVHDWVWIILEGFLPHGRPHRRFSGVLLSSAEPVRVVRDGSAEYQTGHVEFGDHVEDHRHEPSFTRDQG